MKNNWIKYKPDQFHKGSNCLYQKIIYKNQEKIGLNIYEYKMRGELDCWELDMQFRSTIIDKTINVLVFIYTELNFKQIEQHARKIINRLIK